MEAVNDDDEAMMAMMGLTGFGSTKVQSPHFCHVFLLLIPLARVSMSSETKRVQPMSRNHEHGDSI